MTQASSVAKKSGPLRRLLQYAQSYHRRMLLASSYSILNKVFDLAPPVLIGTAVDIVIKKEQSLLASYGLVSVKKQMFALALVTVLIWLAESIFEYLYKVYWRNLAQDLQHDLRMDAYSHTQTLELAYFEDRSTGGLMSILNDDINQLERFLDNGANELLQVTTTALLIGAAFFIVAPSVAWFAVLPIPLVIGGSFIFQRRIAPHYAHVRSQVGVLNSLLSNNISGVATIKSFTAELRETERVRVQSEEYKDRNSEAIRLSSAFSPLIRMAIVIGFTATLVYGGFLTIDGEIEVGTYSVLVFLTQRLLWPLTRLGTTVDLFQRGMASADRVLDLLDTSIGIQDGHQSLPLAEVRGSIALEAVDFSYNNRLPVLKSLSLEIPAGQSIAIVGSTGAGKSSLIKLLLRFYDVSGGRITLDAIDLRALKQSDLRRAMGLVSQDVFLFHGTVLENICYGRPEASPEEVVEAAKLAEAHDFIMKFPQGYETIVGERGQKLSGGQRQRLSIARAVLKNPPILILDEATSSVDNETEGAIQRSLEKLVVGRTTIMIAHRLSTIRKADCIYVLQEGQISESGTHESLLEQKAIYAALWGVQTGETATRIEK
jgi:ATP-binding cassette, subfamily B, bacterial